MSKIKLFEGVPIHRVMAFNYVSAPAHVGKAMVFRVDGALDNEPDVEVIVVARSESELRRFHSLLGRKFPPMSAVREMAVASTQYLTIKPFILNGENGRANPHHQDQPTDEDEL